MKENLRIKNFLVIKQANVEIKKFNVLIGPQANGKSLIAKLLSFFNSTPQNILESIRLSDNKRELDKSIILMFESRFPRYSWEGTSFEIEYEVDGIVFNLLGKRNSKGKTNIQFNYSENLSKSFKRSKALFKRKLAEEKADKVKARALGNVERHVIYEHISEPLKEEYPSLFSDSVFIPASRSFFANLQKNIFTFLASNLDIDPYLKDFGKIYENSKFWYKDDFLMSHHRELLNSVYKIIEAIVQGEYEFDDEQDWILSKGKKINLANASSGQQESLPMLLVLCVWPIISDGNKGIFFIEEPEAHLFPTSQSHIVSLLSLLHESLGTRFFITSHSPYILSAINNFILASDSVLSGEITKEEFVKINGSGAPISFDEISAYTILNGHTSNISDPEYRMIGGDLLDGVSEHFEDVMNKLLSCSDE